MMKELPILVNQVKGRAGTKAQALMFMVKVKGSKPPHLIVKALTLSG